MKVIANKFLYWLGLTVSLKLLFSSSFLIFSVFFFSAGYSFSGDVSKIRLSLVSEEKTIHSLTKDIFEQTGVTLVFPENFYRMKFTGKFTNVTLDVILSSILKGINYSLEATEDQTIVIVHLFNFASIPTNADQTNQTNLSSPQALYEEMIHTAQKNVADHQLFLDNPRSIDPVSGSTFEELAQKAALAESAIAAFINNDTAKDPHSGISMGELKSIWNENISREKQFLNDPLSKDPVTGENLQFFLKIAAQHQAIIDKNSININNYLPKPAHNK